MLSAHTDSIALARAFNRLAAEPSRLRAVSVLRQARRRSTQLASSAFGSVQLRSLRAR